MLKIGKKMPSSKIQIEMQQKKGFQLFFGNLAIYAFYKTKNM
jgi:hypothetical protein